MKLAYQAYDQTGKKTVKDVIDAADTVEATEKLRRQGLYVSELSVAGDAATPPTGGRRRYGRGTNLKSLAVFTRQLYVLLSTGTPVAETLAAVQRQIQDGRWSEVIGQIRQGVERGSALSEAMREHPGCFDSVYCSLIEAGESSGKLPEMLDRLASLTQQQLRVRSSVLGAMVYPSLLVVVATVVMMVMMVFVLPRFGELFESLGQPLPPTTVFVMALSQFASSFWWVILLLLVATGVGTRSYLDMPAGKRVRDTALIRLPQIRRFTRNFATARLTRLLGVLLESHLPLLHVLGLVRGTTRNYHYVQLLKDAEDAVTRGDPVSSAFDNETLIDPSVYEAMRSGEQSGKTGYVLSKMADFLDEENEVLVRTLTSVIEPIILILLGLMVGFIAVTMFMPLFDLAATTGGFN